MPNSRQLSYELRSFFENRLFKEKIPEPFITKTNLTAMLLLTAMSCRDVREKGSNNHGEIVEMFQATVGDVDYSSWCLSFIQSCIAFVEDFAGVQSLIPATEHCLNLWNTAPPSLREPVANSGNILIWRKDGSIQGHCGLVVQATRLPYYQTIEGNTSGEDGFERDGQGVYLRTRKKTGIVGFTALGFLRVFEKPS